MPSKQSVVLSVLHVRKNCSRKCKGVFGKYAFFLETIKSKEILFTGRTLMIRRRRINTLETVNHFTSYHSLDERLTLHLLGKRELFFCYRLNVLVIWLCYFIVAFSGLSIELCCYFYTHYYLPLRLHKEIK